MKTGNNVRRGIVFLLLLALAVLPLGGCFGGCQKGAPIVERSYSTKIYIEQGAAKQVYTSGAEAEFRSGSTLDVDGTADFTNATVSGLAPGTIPSNLVITGTLTVSGTSNLVGNVSDSGGTLTFADDAAVVGQADAIQLKVTGYTTQTTPLLVLEQSGGTDVLVVSNDGEVAVAGQSDAIQLLVTGYTTQTTSLLVLEQSGGTDAFTVSNDGDADVVGTLQYGANNLYALGHASSGYQTVVGTSLVTGTAVAAHGLTTVTFALCTLGEDPTSGAGDGAMCTLAVSSNTVTVKVWQDDFVTAATEVDVDVHWLVVGQP